MNTAINFAEMLTPTPESVRLPEGTLCAWVRCCNCSRWAEWNPDQGAYWCWKWKEHTVDQGCSFGDED